MHSSCIRLMVFIAWASVQDPLHPEYGVLMAPHLNAQIHQHFFQVRLDMAVDNDNGGEGLVVT